MLSRPQASPPKGGVLLPHPACSNDGPTGMWQPRPPIPESIPADWAWEMVGSSRLRCRVGLSERPTLAYGAERTSRYIVVTVSRHRGLAADVLLDRFGPARVAQAFVRLWREGRSAPEELSDLASEGSPSLPGSKPRREHAAFEDAAWFALPVGRTGRAEARWLLPKICEAGGVTRDAIGAIRVQANETFVQIAAAEARRFGEGFEVVPGLALRRL